ncbi:MAG TPA: L,D-transpeptidase, partial [Pyrinomonadaceae bacterium]|nr:L,D-transpeptidase [Pyrinomonadaceae bacterium]
MKDFLRAVIVVAALSGLIVGAGCVAESPNTANTNAAATTSANISATPSPTASPTVNASVNNLPVTLPVLDAMFSDEAFASELKSKLQLTDEQISKLRSVAREETGKLRETDTDEYPGTTAAARRQADEQIKSVVGEEKAGQLAAFVRERWSGETGATGGGTSTSSTTGKMNAVPTDTRVVVNAPAYRMDVFENGQLVKTYKVGIGYPEFPLPTGQRRADTIIFNPTWTPPDEPWVESPSSKVKVGEKVEAGSPLNPLGPIKIPIGMPSLIHGGKSPAKLGTFASHGCVGLTNPQVQDFAQVLGKLGGTQITPEDVANYAKTKTETKNVKLSNAVPVELRYETIV